MHPNIISSAKTNGRVYPDGDARVDFHCFLVLKCNACCLARVHVKDGGFWSGLIRWYLLLTHLESLWLLVAILVLD
jgi:hypothetical protein